MKFSALFISDNQQNINVPVAQNIAMVDTDLNFTSQSELDSVTPNQEFIPPLAVDYVGNELHSLGGSSQVIRDNILFDRGISADTNNSWMQIIETTQLFR